MKLTFLGTTGFFSKGDNFHSNVLLESNAGKNLLIDCGTDIARSLDAANRRVEDIDAIYISHLHGDHFQGLEYIGFYNYFINGKKKIPLFVNESIVDKLWNNGLSASMSMSADGCSLKLENYFDVKSVKESFMWEEFDFWLVPRLHVGSNYSFGLIIKDRKHQIYLSSDSSSGLYPIGNDILNSRILDSDILFHDCDVMNITDVHAHYDELANLPAEIKRKMWLYHYTDLGDKMPDVVKDGFLGFVQRGQVFEMNVEWI